MKIYGTETAEGYIPHFLRGDGLVCPVKLCVNPLTAKFPQPPMRRNGRLVYALPGGGSFTA